MITDKQVDDMVEKLRVAFGVATTDVTMCVGTGCPLCETCYRYMAEPNYDQQNFADFTGKVTQGEDGFGTPAPDCPEYVPNASAEKTQQTEE